MADPAAKRRAVFIMAGGEAKEPVRVVVRLRPEEESPAGRSRSAAGGRLCVVTDNHQTVSLLPGEEGQRQPHNASGRVSLGLSSSFSSSNGGSRPGTRGAKAYTFDRAFGPYSTQHDIYEVARPLVESVIKGYNATIFAYGVTGSGKTYTMTGTQKHPGVIPRAVADVFNLIRQATEANGQQESMFLVWLTYVELYNNKFRNLLLEGTSAARRLPSSASPCVSPPSSPVPHYAQPPAGRHYSHRQEASSTTRGAGGKIEVRESQGAGVFLCGPRLRYSVTSAEEALDLIAAGGRQRAVGATACNAHSSRSHAILTFHIESRVVVGGQSEIRVGKLNLVDLAGSERVGLSGAEGATLLETQSINLSLTCLANVLSALSRNALQSSAHHSLNSLSLSGGPMQHSDGGAGGPAPVPYRDSKLTHLLKDSLGGNSKTLMITTLRATEEYHKQTHMSLLYAARAKNIRNCTVVNLDVVGQSGLNKVSSELEALKRRLADRAAELDRLCTLPRGPSDDHERQHTLLRRLEDLEQANAREKKQLEDQLSKIILNQAGQMSQQRQEFSSLQQRLHHQLVTYRHTCEQQQKEITSLRSTLEALRKTQLCSGASEEEVAEMQKVLEAWQTQATATQQELLRASEQLRGLQREREVDKATLDTLMQQLEAARAHERALSAEVSSLRTAVDDVKERDAQMAHAHDEVCRLTQEVERWEREARDKDKTLEEVRTSQLLAHSHQVSELQERQRVLEAEARAARSERDEALRLHRLMMDAADLGDRTSADVEREIVEAKASIDRKEAQLAQLQSQLQGLDTQVAAAQARHDALLDTVHQLHASTSALEEQSSMRQQLDQAHADLATSRRAYQALERRFASSVGEMEGRFRVVLADKDAQVQAAQEGYARLQERLAGFQAQLESAKVEAEAVVSEGTMAADHWRDKAEQLEVQVRTLRAASQRAEEQANVAQRTIQLLKSEVASSREALRGWEEGAGLRAAEEKACTQRAVAVALRQQEQRFAAEKRVLDGVLRAARGREEEAMKMAGEDQRAALLRARDTWQQETQATHATGVQREVQRERRRVEEANKALGEARAEVAALKAERVGLQEAVGQLQQQSTQDHARWTQREHDLQARVRECEARLEQRAQQCAALEEASAQQQASLSQATLESQRLRSELQAEEKREAQLARTAQEHDVAVEGLRAELRGARAEATRRDHEAKDAEAELLRLRRKVAALEEDSTQARSAWQKEREVLLARCEGERDEVVRQARAELSKQIQAAAEASRLRKARERELKARVAEIEALLGTGPAAGEHWSERVRAKIVALEERHAQQLQQARGATSAVVRWLAAFVGEVGDRVAEVQGKRRRAEGKEGGEEEEKGDAEARARGLLESARGAMEALVAEYSRAKQAAAAEAEAAQMVREEMGGREREWAMRLAGAVARAKAEAGDELQGLTNSMQQALEEARELVDRAREEKREGEAKLREALERQAQRLREETQQAVEEREALNARDRAEAHEEGRREERTMWQEREAEWRARVEEATSEGERRVQAAEAREREEARRLMDDKEEQTRALIARLSRQHEEAMREALEEMEGQWIRRSEALSEGRQGEVRVLLEQTERRKEQEATQRLRQALAEREAEHAARVAELREECGAQVEEVRRQMAALQEQAEARAQDAARRVSELQRDVDKAREEVEQRCRQEVAEKQAGLERAREEMHRRVEVGKARETELQARLVELTRQLEEQRFRMSNSGVEWEARAEEAVRSREEVRRELRQAMDRLGEQERRGAEREEWWRKEVERAGKDKDQAWQAEVEALQEGVEERVRQAQEEGRQRLAEVRARDEARLQEALGRERDRWKAVLWRSRRGAMQGWDGSPAVSSSDWEEDETASAWSRSPSGAEAGEAWVASIGQRHKLVAHRLKRQQVEKGVLLLALWASRRAQARGRAALGRWRQGVGFRVVDVQEAGCVLQGLKGLRDQRQSLQAHVHQLKQAVHAELTTLREALHSAALVGSQASPPAPSLLPTSQVGEPHRSLQASVPVAPKPITGEAVPCEASAVAAMETALLEADVHRFARLWVSQECHDRLLPWHVALRGYQFHASPQRLLAMCRGVAALPIDPNQVDTSGSTALHRALSMGPPCALPALSDLLLQAGARPDARNGHGDTAAHLVLSQAGGRLKGHVAVVVEVLHRLVKHGADMNAARLRTPHETPLGMALVLARRTLSGTGKAGVAAGRRRREGVAQAQGSAGDYVRLLLAVVEGGAHWDVQWRDLEEGHSQRDILKALGQEVHDGSARDLYTCLVDLAAAGNMNLAQINVENKAVILSPLPEAE